MPSNRFEVVLSLKDADAVRRGLQSLGADGERALKRLETATQPASRGLQLLDEASGAARGALEEMARQMPGVGAGLDALGKGSLGAAAGIAAAGAAFAALLSRANDVTKHLADIADGAQRAGASAEELQALRQIFIENASSAEEMTAAIERVRVVVGEALGGNEKYIDVLTRGGVTMEQFAATNGDGAKMLELVATAMISIHDPAERAAFLVDVLGKGGKGLETAMSELAGTLQGRVVKGLSDGSIASNELTEKAGKLQDNLDLLNERSKVLGAEGLIKVETGFVHIRNEVVAGMAALVDYYTVLGKVVASGGGIGLLNRQFAKGDASASESEKFALRAQQERAAAAAADREPLPRPVPRPTLGGSGRSRGRSAREPDLGLEMGKAFGDKTLLSTGGGLDRVETTEIEPSYAWKQQHAEADAFYETLSKITEQTTAAKDETAKWYDQITLNTLGIHEAASSIGGLFADAATGEKKLADVLAEIPNLISKIIIQKMVELAITQAIAAASGGMSGAGGALSGLFGSIFGGGGAGSSGGAPMVSGGTNPGFLLGGAAHGAIISRGRADHLSPITAFARGGIIDEPTLFPLHHGMGVAGEAGPEVAIAPLRRMASGDLGVQAMAPKMTVIINNHAGAEVQTKQERGADGSSRLIIDMLKQEIASDMARPGTGLNRAISAANSPLRSR